MKYDKEFDASGLACPLPIVKTKKALSDMAPGQVLRVVATDPGSVADMAAFTDSSPLVPNHQPHHFVRTSWSSCTS